MISKWVALLFCAIALGGCCVSGSGCYGPTAGSPVAWDGLGPSQDLAALHEETSPVADGAAVSGARVAKPVKKLVRASDGETAGSAFKPHSDEWWARKEAEERNADKALTRKLIICQGCSPSSPRSEEAATGSVPH